MTDTKYTDDYLELEQFYKKYLPLEVAFEDYSVIVCGQTETAFRWAKKFLEHGFITATEFRKSPAEHFAHIQNHRHISDNFNHIDRLNKDLTAAIATGDKTLDQILASKFYNEGVKIIISETPSRYVNARFPEERTTRENVSPLSILDLEEKPQIRLGVIKSDLENRTMRKALSELEDNFPEFYFKKIELDKYDIKSYGVKSRSIYYNEDFQDIVNQPYDRSFNALFTEDVDLILVKGTALPNFFPIDVDYWPTLIERMNNSIVMIHPRNLNNQFDWPDNQPVYTQTYTLKSEVYSHFSELYSWGERSLDFKILKKSMTLESIYENTPNVVVVASSPYLYENCPNLDEVLEKYGLTMSYPNLAGMALDGMVVGISRKDNLSREMKMLKLAAPKLFPEQSSMFVFEQIYRKYMYPYYDLCFDFRHSGAFLNLNQKYAFRGFAENKHGISIVSNRQFYPTLLEAEVEMYKFIRRALRLWKR